MDPITAVGAAAAVVQLAQLSAQILSMGYGFLAQVSHAPTEIRRLLTEAAAVNVMFGQLEALPDTASSGVVLKSLTDTGIFDECQKILEIVNSTLGEYEKCHKKGLEKIGHRLVWPMKEKEIKDAMVRLSRLRDIISTVIQTGTASALDRIETSQSNVQNQLSSLSQSLVSVTSEAEAEKAVSWLCPESDANLYARLESLLEERQPGTGSGLFSSNPFKHWLERSTGKQILWLTGLPGAGKSVLSAASIEHLRSLANPKSTDDTVVAFFFTGYGFQASASSTSFLMMLAKQFACCSRTCLQLTCELWRQKVKKRSLLTEHEYLRLINDFISSFRHVFIVVDGLDEAPDTERQGIAELLKNLTANTSTADEDSNTVTVKVLLTSRADYKVGRIIGDIAVHYYLLGGLKDDLSSWITSRMERNLTIQRLRNEYPDIVRDLQSELINRSGTFLQAKLHLGIVDNARSARDLREVMKSLSDGYETTYEKILMTIQEHHTQSLDEIKLLLQWLVVGFGPVSTAQLAEVVSMRPGDDSLDFEGVPANVNEIIAPISQLVVTRRVGSVFLVYLLHKTVKEFLTSDALSASPARSFHIDVGTAHARVGDMCLQYLTFSDFDVDLPPRGKVICGKHGAIISSTPGEETPTAPMGTALEHTKRYWLYPYAAQQLLKHLMIIEERSAQCDSVQARLHEYWASPNEKKRRVRDRMATLLGDADAWIKEPIYYAIFAHLHRFMDSLLLGQTDVNQYFDDGMTCLTAAAFHNNIEAATKLLDLGAHVNLPTTKQKKGLTPLHLAAESGHEQMVDLLLSRGANIHLQSSAGTTAFYRAARGGSIHILRRLYELGSDVDAPTWDGWAALMEAIENQRLEAVLYLLKLGANPQTETKYGETPLSLARECRQVALFGKAGKHEDQSETVWWKIQSAVETALEASRRREIETVTPSIPSGLDAVAMSSAKWRGSYTHSYKTIAGLGANIRPRVPENSAMPSLVGDALGSRSIPYRCPDFTISSGDSGLAYGPTEIETDSDDAQSCEYQPKK